MRCAFTRQGDTATRYLDLRKEYLDLRVEYHKAELSQRRQRMELAKLHDKIAQQAATIAGHSHVARPHSEATVQVAPVRGAQPPKPFDPAKPDTLQGWFRRCQSYLDLAKVDPAVQVKAIIHTFVNSELHTILMSWLEGEEMGKPPGHVVPFSLFTDYMRERYVRPRDMELKLAAMQPERYTQQPWETVQSFIHRMEEDVADIKSVIPERVPTEAFLCEIFIKGLKDMQLMKDVCCKAGTDPQALIYEDSWAALTTHARRRLRQLPGAYPKANLVTGSAPGSPSSGEQTSGGSTGGSNGHKNGSPPASSPHKRKGSGGGGQPRGGNSSATTTPTKRPAGKPPVQRRAGPDPSKPPAANDKCIFCEWHGHKEAVCRHKARGISGEDLPAVRRKAALARANWKQYCEGFEKRGEAFRGNKPPAKQGNA
jgi:hypothetical protein